MTMADKAFVDANVLLRAMFYGMNSHEVCRGYIKRLQAEEAELWISHHVIREFCVQATHPDTLAKEPHIEKVKEVNAATSGPFIRRYDGRVPIDFISPTDQVA